MKPTSYRSAFCHAFTLIELMTAVAIALLLVLGLMTVTNVASATWSRGENQIEKRRNARASIELVSRDLRGAILPLSGTPPSGSSNLRFVLNPQGANLDEKISNPDAVFWQTTTATDTALGEIAAVGYFVRYATEQGRPKFKLCRLFINASEQADYKVYEAGSEFAWLSPAILDAYTSASSETADKFRGLLADDILGLWIRCLDPEGLPIVQTAALTAYPDNSYDSNLGYAYNNGTIKVLPPALPASVEIRMVVLDSRTASKLTTGEADQIRSNHAKDPVAFVSDLPESIRGEARIVSTKVLLPRS